MSLYADIVKTFPDFELAIQLQGEQEVLALLGASGCGKSITLKCIAGIVKPDKGHIVLNGKTVFDSERKINVPPQERKVGYLFQNYALFPNMTVWDNIACVIQKPKAERNAVVGEIIKTFFLENIKTLYPRQISGGQQQRVAIARILVSDPQILMLDEPFSALDSYLKWNMEQEMLSVLESFMGTTLLVSHDRDEVYRLSDRIAVMNDGKIELIGSKKEIFDSPKTLASALITGCKNISRAEKIDETSVRATDWNISLKTEGIVPDNIQYIGIRAHHFLTVPQAENNFSCCVNQIIDDTFESIVVFSFIEGSGKKLRYEVAKENWNYRAGQNLTICVPKDKIMFLE